MEFSCPGCAQQYLFMIDPEFADIDTSSNECVCKMLQKLEAKLIELKLKDRRAVSPEEAQKALEWAEILIENAELASAVEWAHKCLLLNGMNWRASALRDRLKVCKSLRDKLEVEGREF